MKLTDINAFVSEYFDRTDIPAREQNPVLVKRFAISVAQTLSSEDAMQHMVALLPVNNYCVKYPDGFSKIIQLGYHDNFIHDRRHKFRDEVVEWIMDTAQGCEAKITIECPECHKHECECGDDKIKIDVDTEWLLGNPQHLAWYRTNFFGYGGLRHSLTRNCVYHSGFQLMIPAQHNFFGTDYHIRHCINLDKVLRAHNVPEYKIEKDFIRTNRENGTVLLAYYSIYKDEDGYELIPDDSDVFEAMFWSVESKMLYREARRNPKMFSLSREAKVEAKNWYKIAKSKIDMMSPSEWRGLLRNYHKKIRYRDAEFQADRMISDQFNQMP